jgi:AraC family transcriptional regulator, regulatory protein of adaptative response / methylated-DNA-[protein]-cysteine methyltransferase
MNTQVDPSEAVGLTDETRWRVVLARDKTFDGEFVFAVRTTGVYCRASCPSKTAKRENVQFFDTTYLAKAAGFRACKRCTPDDMSLEHRRNDWVVRACALMKSSAAPLKLSELAAELNLSPHHLHRVFKEVIGLTPKDYQRALTKARVTNALDSAPSITDAIYDAGFNSSGRFYEGADAMLGMTPKRFRQGGAGESLRYAVEPCALGVILIAATVRGVCAIEFGDSAHDLLARLRQRFPNAALRPADAIFKTWIGRVLDFIDQPNVHSNLRDMPLDIQGTAFQQRVWKALQDIPMGKTVSYAAVAEAIGKPKAVRAVAQACAANEIAVAIPCHRVVRSDGSLSGYRWGVARKADLLKREAKK